MSLSQRERLALLENTPAIHRSSPITATRPPTSITRRLPSAAERMNRPRRRSTRPCHAIFKGSVSFASLPSLSFVRFPLEVACVLREKVPAFNKGSCLSKKNVRVSLSHSLAPLKQQVMVDTVCHWSRTHASRLIGVEPPAILLPFLNRLTDILMVVYLHAFPFFHLNLTSVPAVGLASLVKVFRSGSP